MRLSLQFSQVGKLKKSTVTAADSGSSEFTSRRLFIQDPYSKLEFLIDTGADVSVVPKNLTDQVNKTPTMALIAANGSPINVYGSRLIKTNFGLRRDFHHSFFVADVTKPILGADFLHKYGILVDIKNSKLIDPTTGLNSIGVVKFDSTPSPKAFDLQTNEFCSILRDFPSLTQELDFTKSPVKHNILHHIHTHGPLPVSRARRLDPARLKIAKDEFDYMMKIGVCRPSNSPCSSPLHMAPKSDPMDWRPCGDYRRLNAVTTPDRYPVPFITDANNDMSDCEIVSKVDIVRAFHHVPVAPEDVHKTAIITPFGLFEFPQMNFGMRGAGQSYQRFMNLVLHDFDFTFCYLDDILIKSRSVEEHKRHLRLLFERLDKYGLKIKLSKCVFGVSVLEFLGHEISKDGIKPLPSKVKDIVDFPQPTSIRSAQRFTGMINFYQRFLKGIAGILAPINTHIAFLQNGSKSKKSKSKNNKISENKSRKAKALPFSWPAECVEAVEKAKQSVANFTMLNHPKSGADFRLTCDASDLAIGSVLEQKCGDDWQPIAFFSKKLSPPQQRYSTFDRELLAIYLSIMHFQHFLEAREFHVLTDHKPLTHALLSKTDKNPRQSRHLDYISQFTSDIRYIKGEENTVADCMSRLGMDAIDFLTPNLEELAKIQENDPELAQLRTNPPQGFSFKLERVNIPASDKALWCETSTGKNRPFIPESIRKRVFNSLHNVSHPSVRNSKRRVTERYFWLNMSTDIVSWARACDQCQRQKISRHTKAPLDPIAMPSGRFKHIHVDLVGPLPPSDGNYYILTIIDRFSRWPEAYPIPDMTAETVAKTIFYEYIPRFGTPEKLTSDQGSQFESKIMEQLCQFMNIKRIRTTAYHPQANGMLERFHRTLKAALRATGDFPHWSRHIPLVLLGLRTTYKEDIKASPAELLYGERLCLPNEFFIESPSSLDPAEFVNRLRDHFSHIRAVDPRPQKTKVFVPKTLSDCKSVYVRVDRIQAGGKSPYEGPFEVIQKSPKYFKIRRDSREVNMSIDRLKPCFALPEDSQDNFIAPDLINDPNPPGAIPESRHKSQRHVHFAPKDEVHIIHEDPPIASRTRSKTSRSR